MHRQSSPERSSETQGDMTEDEDEPRDLKILKEEPDNSDKTCEGLNKLPEEKPVNPTSSQVFSLPGTSYSTSYKNSNSFYSFRRRLPELIYQLPGGKTVITASPSSQVSSPYGLPCYSTQQEGDDITRKSSLGAENYRIQFGIKGPIQHLPSYFRAYPTDLSGSSPSDIDELNHPDLGKQSEKITEPDPQPDSLLTGVGQQRNKDSQQQSPKDLGRLLSNLSDNLDNKLTSPLPLVSFESARPAFGFLGRISSSLFSSKKPSDSTDLHSRNQTSSSDLTSSSTSSSSDSLYLDAEVDQIDILSEINSLVETEPPEWFWTPDSSEGRRKSSCLSHSSPSLNQIISTENSNFKRAASLPNMKLKSSFEEFTPDFTDDEEDGSYRFQCSGPGLYLCRETSLVFNMEAEGEVIYRIVPWNRRSLSQHRKKPAGPLFDISCVQQSVSRLHLPHCEIPSTGGCHFLSVAHIKNEVMELIKPAEITETHIIINIKGFSAFGNVKDEDSPPDPVRALVLLFYKPPVDPNTEHKINVLMLPKNVVLRDVLHFRKQLDKGEIFLEMPPHCKLQPKQVYTLSTDPGDDSVQVQPPEAEFDEEPYDNYFTAFLVTYENLMKHIKLFLKDSSSSSVWERRVCLSSSGVKRSCGSTHQNLCPKDLLAEIRLSFIDGVSEPVLKALMDKLLQEKVINDTEKEAILMERGRRDKASCVIDTVRRKGDSASSEMIKCLCALDPFLCEHLGLM